jgi:bifunctional NMN adenylyltransferase/nudix hydrolase
MKYDTLVFIGRFQPVHNAHLEIIRRAMNEAKQLIIIIGSAKQPRTYKNPWSALERRFMLQNAIDQLPQTNCAVRIEENTDSIYSDKAWLGRVQLIVAKHTQKEDSIAVIGHRKDSSSDYLSMFPQWGYVNVDSIQPLNAMKVRDLYFRKDCNLNFLTQVVPQSVMRMLEGWKDTPDYNQIIREREFVENYQKQYASLPYAPVFVTVDAVVFCNGHVLMIKRKAEPGKGLWALPGGFLNAVTDKSVKSAMIRELREETGIKVPEPVLLGSITHNMVFDSIERSTRGRTITHAFRIDLESTELPKVKGADDAEKAKWVPVSEVKSELCYDDHFDIMLTLGKL